MPRLYGTNEARDLNVYDAAFDGLDNSYSGGCYELSNGYTKLFDTIRHIGFHELSNMQVPGQLVCDQTAFITNVYARTNIPPCQALADWANSAHATVMIGCMRQHQINLADLLRRPDSLGELAVEIQRSHDQEAVFEIARLAFAAHQQSGESRLGLFDLPRPQINAWVDVARAMHRLLRGPRALVVPVRQNFGVRIEGGRDAFLVLREYVRANLGEGDGGQIQPRARLWVHLEGVGFPVGR